MFTVHFTYPGLFPLYLSPFQGQEKMHDRGVCFVRPSLYKSPKDVRREFSVQLIITNKPPRSAKAKCLSQSLFMSKWPGQDVLGYTLPPFSVLNPHGAFLSSSWVTLIWMMY